MQNSLNKERNIVEFTSPTKVATDVIKGSTISPMSKVIEPKTAQIKPLKLNCIYVVKKDGTKEEFDNNKIINAVKKSATRMLVEFTDVELKEICDFVDENIVRMNKQEVTIADMHNLVEGALEHISPKVAQSYRNYRNYKQDFVHMLDKVYQESQRIMYIGDKENANADSTLVSTKRSLIFNELNKELYKKFFLTVEEIQAIKDGYIYIHDLGARMDTYNCCLFDMGKVLQGGFEWEHIGYNEPKDVRTACNLISDITLNCAAQQYGGFTVPEIDSILAPYARKSYNHYLQEYYEIAEGETTPDSCVDSKRAHRWAMQHVERDICQGFQGFEHTFNTVASSRGDYPFVTMTGGCEEDEFGQLVWHCALKVRREGQGHPGKKRPAIFPKLVFLYTKKLHAEGKKMHYLFLEGVETSAAAMYPDWLSLDKPANAKSALADVFAKYHKFGTEYSRWKLGDDNKVYENTEWVDSIVSPMGKRKLQLI